MNYYPLRFTNKAAADSALYRNGQLIHRCTFIRGIIYSSPVFDDNGNLITPPVASVGYHADIADAGSLDNSLLPYVIPFPLTPKYVFYNEQGGAI